MIQDAFQNNLWDSPALANGFTQMEANFSLFWGLAIQLYEATLVSDQTPFDRFLGGDTLALTAQQQLGFAIFDGATNCSGCHVGSELTSASVSNIAFVSNVDNGLLDLMFSADLSQNIYDEGFNNTGVRPTTDDVGRGGTTPATILNPLNGDVPFPLSYSRLAELQAQGLLPFSTPVLPANVPASFPVNADGSFKMPGLRNVELTAPYFHNGGVGTLEDVVDFYARGGDFPLTNSAGLDPRVAGGIPLLQGDPVKKAALVAFLKSLTDPRVAKESAPFDHPEILVPSGDPEALTRIPARDANGSAALTGILTLNPVATPTRINTQTISGTVQAGLTPVVTVNTTAVVGPVSVVGTDWSAQISGLVLGANTITVSVVDLGGVTTTLTATITFDNNFADVPPTYFAYTQIMAIANAGISSGCGGVNFCPDSPITRGQMAVFVETSLAVPAPPACAGNVFTDVTAASVGAALCGFIEGFATKGITGGCGGGNFCPNDPVTRGQMAVFIEAALGNPASPCADLFADSTGAIVGSVTCGFIERLAGDGITGGCGPNLFCPNDPVTRAQMAVFIVAAPPPLLP